MIATTSNREIGSFNVQVAQKPAAPEAPGPGELMGLRLRDVFVDNPETARIYIHEHVKNNHRIREVPLNTDALTAV